MKLSIRSIFIALVSLTILLSGCAPAQTPVPATLTPLPSNTPKPTNTPSLTPTLTFTPTLTSTPTKNFSTYEPAPRWILLAQPGYDVEILGETWNYKVDDLDDAFACNYFTKEKEPILSFNQCFALNQSDSAFEDLRDELLNNEFEVLIPDNKFGDVGQISLMASRVIVNSQKLVSFIELIGTDKYMLHVEMNVITDDTSPLQDIYEDRAASTIDYVLQNMLEKSRLIPRPTATPLSPEQDLIYAFFSKKLITESEASALSGSQWEALGDIVVIPPVQVCRDFEDRSNDDALWVFFANCVIASSPPTFEELVDVYKQSGVLLESSHQYNDNFVLYGSQDGHTRFYAFLQDHDFVYFVYLESRTIGGQGVEDIFTDEVDDFIYGVLMKDFILR